LPLVFEGIVKPPTFMATSAHKAKSILPSKKH